MSAELRTRIKLRKDTESNWESVNPVLLNGEIAISLDVAKGNAIRLKVGDGLKTYNQLSFLDDDSLFKRDVIYGYMLNGEFYRNSAYQLTYEKTADRLYVDRNSSKLYFYDCIGEGCTYTYKEIEMTLPTASDSVAGVAKLYSTYGQNTDGAMSQKAVTDGVNSIQFGIEDEDCLVLQLPWN